MSQFLNDPSHYNSEQSPEIDFDDAIRLPDGGSICEIYRTKWQRHEVFVKRLKEKYRNNPLYLDALDKEYEIGVNLKHPSLPDYREFHRDYIVMDYIDGITLAEMIKRHDPLLCNERFIIRMLRELLSVVDYLHRHNVTHCDIKPDNIMITSNNHNLVLIDLDKCYTDSLNDTSGDPSKYGLTSNDKGSIAIDFHGIARVVEKMKEGIPQFKFSKYQEFLKECDKPNPSTEDLLQILDYNPSNSSKKLYWMVTFAPFCVALLFGLVLWLTQKKDGYDDSYGIIKPSEQTLDSIEKSETQDKTVSSLEEEKGNLTKHNDEETETVVPSPVTQEQIHEQAKKMAAILDKRIQPLYDKLNINLNNLLALSENPEVSGKQLLDSIRKFGDREDECNQETFEILKETYPGLTDREFWRVLAYSKAYTGFKRRSEPILKELGKKVE